jgi:predicted Zn-dependent protease
MKWISSLAGAIALVALAGTTGFAAPQQQQNPQQITQQSTQKQTETIPQKKEVDVKKGSQADVNAIGNRNVGKGLDFYSLEREIALGKQLAQEVERSSRFVDDPAINAYVNKVGQNLVRNSDARVPFTIKVIDSDVVNAFALPGGFFFVNSGLIVRADNEAQLAGVMAHEIAHVAARHGTKNATKAQLMQMAMIPLVILGPGGWAGYGLYEGLNISLPIAFLRFSRSAERQADYLGLQYMYKAGYDPNDFVSFFEKIEAEDRRHPGTIPKIFATHPPTPDRIAAAQKEIATILPSRPEYIVDTSEFEQIKHRLQVYESGRRIQDKKNGGPTLRQKTADGKKTDDKPPVLKKRNPDDPHL